LSLATEDVLVQRACKGDKEAFSELIQLYQDRIFNTLYRMSGSLDEAEESAQEAFIKAYQSIGRFKQESQFSTWLYRIAVNTFLTRMRKVESRKKLGGVSLDAEIAEDTGMAAMIASPHSEDPALTATRKETKVVVQQAISSLEDDFRSVVVLRDIEGRGYAEIAEILEISISAVKARLTRARLKLATFLKDVV